MSQVKFHKDKLSPILPKYLCVTLTSSWTAHRPVQPHLVPLPLHWSFPRDSQWRCLLSHITHLPACASSPQQAGLPTSSSATLPHRKEAAQHFSTAFSTRQSIQDQTPDKGQLGKTHTTWLLVLPKASDLLPQRITVQHCSILTSTFWNSQGL